MPEKILYVKKLLPKWTILFSIFVAVFSFGGNAGNIGSQKISSVQTEWFNTAKPSAFTKSFKIHQNLSKYFYQNHLNTVNSFSYNILIELNNLLVTKYVVIRSELNSFNINATTLHLKIIPALSEEVVITSFIG